MVKYKILTDVATAPEKEKFIDLVKANPVMTGVIVAVAVLAIGVIVLFKNKKNK